MTQLRDFPYASTTAAGNMAFDSAMLSACLPRDQILWRFYGWDEPAITFGYSQKWEWVRQQTGNFEGTCIRRLTGGGIVDHRDDLTYSLAIPATHRFHRSAAQEIYRELHQGIADVLCSAGLRAELAPCPGPCAEAESQNSGVCFQSPEPFDVIAPDSGLKIAGAAMKRNKEGILIQGSLSRAAESLPQKDMFIAGFGRFLEKWLEAGPTNDADPISRDAIAGEESRFASSEWNFKR
ncbi:lipoate--protein ligase family protein [Puniceicoccales bacterium CK1056]|uniref:Lipoate--protein ligase family protein n=1 Tax=Oceanipulchritudo coccoides TaxID=2706888 RepID=A0A6B2M059_9BACT|nr:lipoate--protein ligase family protein [Oceanipulchritudo coccoides]NDV61140.1 lipoate--protein ligase family protein [Oceanipulchritudo coccoides]